LHAIRGVRKNPTEAEPAAVPQWAERMAQRGSFAGILPPDRLLWAKVKQTLRKLSDPLSAARFLRPTTAQSRKNRENWLLRSILRRHALTFRTVRKTYVTDGAQAVA